MFAALQRINARPEPFAHYTASDLWTDEHISAQMLALHLNPDVDAASRTLPFIDRSAAWIQRRFDVGPETRVADFGCGPGLYTTRLARTGAGVTGIDFSARSIAHARDAARQEGLDIHYVEQDYLTYSSGERFDLLLMVYCDFAVLSLAQRGRLLDTYRTVLKPEGAVLLDVPSLAAFEAHQEQALYERDLMDGFWSPRPYYGFQNTFKYEREKLLLDKYTIIEADRTRTIYNWLQCFAPDALRKELAAHGLVVEEVVGNVAGAPYDAHNSEFAVIARQG